MERMSVNYHISRKLQPIIATKRTRSSEWTQKTVIIAVTTLIAVGHAEAQVNHFPDARESDERLLELFENTGDLCVRNRSHDVQVAVACYSMGIYGMALNERGLCFGKENEANAFAEWHPCESGSRYFPNLDLPSGFQ